MVKHGFGEILRMTGILRVFRLGSSKRSQKKVTQNLWVRIRIAVEELGPTFIKLGQILSNRPDLLPEELIKELSKLQEHVSAVPFSEARVVLEESLEGEISEFFDEFDEEPIAAASIAQVYRARISTDGVVAVKVRRPGIQKLIEVDTDIMLDLAALLEKHVRGLRSIQPKRIVAEFRRGILKELDFENELRCLQSFGAHFQGDERAVIPKPFPGYSSESVLVMDFVEGKSVNEIIADEEMTVQEKSEFIWKLADLFFDQVLNHGSFHADPHPGNILRLEDGRICFLDFGMTGSVTEEQRKYIADIIVSVAAQDYKRLTQVLMKLTHTPHFQNYRDFEVEVEDLADEYYDMSFEEINIAEFVNKLFSILLRFEIRFPPKLYLLVKTLITIEGYASQLDPNFSVAEVAKPYAKELVKERYGVKGVLHSIKGRALELNAIAGDFPADFRDIINLLKQGKMIIEVSEKSTKTLHQTLLQATNSFVSGLVLAALILGSSFILQSNACPVWRGVPLFAVLGFVFSGIFAIVMLIRVAIQKRQV